MSTHRTSATTPTKPIYGIGRDGKTKLTAEQLARKAQRKHR